MTPEEINEHIENVWTLAEYITWLNSQNPQGFNLTSNLEHWYDYDIYTASELAEYLDEWTDE